jgi:hypothetical protein
MASRILGAMGLLTGGAFPQGGAIMFKHLPCRKKPKALQNAHTLNNLKVTMGAPWSAVLLQKTEPLNVYPYV